jgi:putative peptide zinc metalloprotease protein
MTTTVETPNRETAVEQPPQLAAGVELIGEYKDSGFKDPPYIARRADGQVIQLPRLLYLVAEATDGHRDFDEIGEEVSRRFGRGLDADGVELLVDKKLRPLGVLADADGSSPELPKSDPMLALKAKTAVIPERAVMTVARIFRPLFFPPVVAAVLVTFFALDVWLFLYHGVAQGMRQTLYDPLFILLLLGLVVLSAAFHECGHATACHYGGAKPGAMGAGIYIVWPALYTDVTDAYRLGKAGRLRTDLGGVYFNSIFSLATFGVYFLTGWEMLLIVVPLQIMEMLHQLLPFIRLDGYYVVGDLTGVPDMFARIKGTLKSLNPLAESPPEVTQLKPWVRVAVSGYVFSVVPLLMFLLGLTALNMPRIVATAWDSLVLQNARLHLHVAASQYLHVAVDAIQMAVLVLPVAGLYATFWKFGRTLVGAAWARTEGRKFARALLVGGTAAAAAIAAYTWLPNGDYRPIQAAEAGTVRGGLGQVRAIPSGRPSLTVPRAKALGGAPWRAPHHAQGGPKQQPSSPTGPATTTTSPPPTTPAGGAPGTGATPTTTGGSPTTSPAATTGAPGTTTRPQPTSTTQATTTAHAGTPQGTTTPTATTAPSTTQPTTTSPTTQPTTTSPTATQQTTTDQTTTQPTTTGSTTTQPTTTDPTTTQATTTQATTTQPTTTQPTTTQAATTQPTTTTPQSTSTTTPTTTQP